MKKNNLNYVLLVLLTLFKGVEALIIVSIIGYTILAIVVVCILVCVVYVVCICGGVTAVISETTRSRTGTTTVNRLVTVQELHPITPQPNGLPTPEGLPTVYLQSPQEAFEAVCVPRGPPTSTAPPAEPPPPYPGEETPPAFVVFKT